VPVANVVLPVVTCQHCGAEVPDGEYCTRCGAHRTRGVRRLHDFVARPGEHVATPSVLTTLLPRLEHSRVHLFRWGLLAGVAAVALLAATGLVIVAIWVAALVVPALYILYLREVEIFTREPLLVLLGTVVAGAALGVAVTAAADSLGSGLGPGGVILLTCGVAVVAELLKPAAPLLLLRRRFPHTLDGLVLGVAAGAGYALAQTLVNLVGGLGGVSLRTDPANWVFTLFSAALLIPLLHGSCTGLVAASLWRPRGGRDAALRAAGLPLAVIADVGFTAGSEVLDDAGLSPLFVLLWQALVVAAVLIAIRLLIHAAVLDEATEHGLREVVCHHCGRRVEAAGFCPQCGAAVATPVAVEVEVVLSP
jgi:RsiW-degrading membrane proteinase PrsW (M82 family)